MSTRSLSSGAAVRDNRTMALVTALVEADLVPRDRRDQAVEVVDRTLAGQAMPAAPLGRRFAELAGYVGGTLVVAAAALFFSTQWDGLSTTHQVALLAGAAVLLAVGGGAVVISGRGRGALRHDTDPVRRRLAGVLFTGAAASASSGLALQVAESTATSESPELLLGFLAFAVLSLAGYLVAPTIVGQLGTAVGAVMTVPSALDLLGTIEPVAMGIIVLLIGVVWVALAERGLWREAASGRVIGCAIAVLGAQMAVFDYDLRWVGYVLTVGVGVAAFATYVVRPAWPYLATGVAAVTLGVPEALIDWTEGSLGPAGALLAAGAALLVGSLVGFRLRKEVNET